MDYIAISKRFHTVFVKDIPQLDLNKKTQAKRFIVLIDALYEHRCKLICSAEARHDLIFRVDQKLLTADADSQDLLETLNPFGSGVSMFSGEEEVFQFARCVSRLTEMQSDVYLETNRSSDLS